MENHSRNCCDYCCYSSNLFCIMQFVNISIQKKNVLKKHLISMSICLGVFILNNVWLKDITTGKLNMLCRCYLNDLVCPLFFLGYCQLIFIWIKNEIKSYGTLLLIGMTAGFIWEYFAPVINPKAVTDSFDLLCYFIGINIYYGITFICRRAAL